MHVACVGWVIRRMRQAMDIMGFSGEEQSAVMRVVAAVLHIGNLRFQLKQQTDPNSPEAAMVGGI